MPPTPIHQFTIPVTGTGKASTRKPPLFLGGNKFQMWLVLVRMCFGLYLPLPILCVLPPRPVTGTEHAHSCYFAAFFEVVLEQTVIQAR